MTSLGRTARRSLALALAASLGAGAATLSAGVPVRGQDRDGSRAEAEPDAPAAEGAAEGDDVDAESREVSEGGEKVKAIRFSGLDVAGRLKSPQLLYFLNRLRAEFDRPRLPHRSFLPEMERSTRSESF